MISLLSKASHSGYVRTVVCEIGGGKVKQVGTGKCLIFQERGFVKISTEVSGNGHVIQPQQPYT